MGRPVTLRWQLGIGLLLTLASPALAQRVVYVRQGATGANSGASWTDAYAELRAALDNAVSGDELWVAAGTYTPTSGTDREATFQLRNNVALYGGFEGVEDSRDDRDWLEHLTTLSGNIGITDDSTDNSYHVTTGSGMDSTSILDGFIITAGFANGVDLNRSGAGMINVDGSPTIRYCHFLRNGTGSGGGGMHNEDGSAPLLEDILFESNRGGTGGGMLNDSSYPRMVRVTFKGNFSWAGGGALYSRSGAATHCIDCTFENNTTVFSTGGAVYISNGPSLFVNTVFVGNHTRNNGVALSNLGSESDFICVRCTFRNNWSEPNPLPGIFSSGTLSSGDGSDITLINTVFENNRVTGRGGGVFLTDGVGRLYNVVLSGNRSTFEGGGLVASAGWFEAVNLTAAGNRAGEAGQHAGAVLHSPGGSTLYNVVLWGNEGANAIGGSSTVEITRGIVEGGCTSLMTCDSVSDGDPFFVRPPFTDGPADYGDLRLRIGSPALDAGLASLLPADAWDLDGDGDTTEPLPLDLLAEPRVQGLQVDLGAYEGGVVVGGEPASPPASLALTMTPNPAAGAVTVSLQTPADGPVELFVFDMLGRRVATLHTGALPAGRHHFDWSPGSITGQTHVTEGVYFVRATTTVQAASRPVTISR